MTTGARRRPKRYLQAWVATAAVAAATSYFLPNPGPSRLGALAGVGSCTALGLLAIYLKQWAIQRSLKTALAIVGILFGARVIALVAGIGLASSIGISAVAFAVGFLSVYFLVQWLEIGYLATVRPPTQQGNL